MPKDHVDVLIVGAGIAGAALAKQYCQLGIEVCIIDAQNGPGKVTSAHAGAITHPAIGRTASKLHTIYHLLRQPMDLIINSSVVFVIVVVTVSVVHVIVVAVGAIFSF